MRRAGQGAHGCWGILFLLLAVIAVIWSFRSMPAARAREAQAVTGSAAITKVYQHWYRRSSKTTLLYSYTYEFSVDGHAYRGMWNADTDGSHGLGEVIPISYLRSNPADNNYGAALNAAPWQSPSLELAMAVILAVMGFALLRN